MWTRDAVTPVAPDSVWMYNPSFALAVLAAALFGLTLAVLFYLTVIRYRAWYFTCVVFGAALELAGYAMRCYSAKVQDNLGAFIVTLSFIVLAPVFVAAGNYLLIGRLIQAVLPAHRQRIFGVHGRWLTRLFVGCDIISFFVQCSGSAIASSGNWAGPSAATGVDVLIGGLSFQVATFLVYLCIFARFHWLARRCAIAEAPGGWQTLVGAVYVSSSLILIRSAYRVAEFSKGVEGYPFTHEWLFWVLEAAPMLVAISVFCAFHPARYLGADMDKRTTSDEEGDQLGIYRSGVRH